MSVEWRLAFGRLTIHVFWPFMMPKEYLRPGASRFPDWLGGAHFPCWFKWRGHGEWWGQFGLFYVTWLR